MSEPMDLGVLGLRDAIASGALSAREVAGRALARIDELDGELGAFLSTRERALDDADEIDARRARGEELGPLAGVPIAVKDNIVIAGEPTTCGSRFLEDFRSPFDAGVVERLRTAGAVVVGKTNLDEFAMGSSTESSAFGPTRNPWASDRAPGGSSGGSAAAVAAGLCAAALGSDTGGSIRQPASFCGITGLKPTYGRVSRYGLVAFGSSLDQVGPMTRTAADAAALLGVLAGHDPRDSTSARRGVEDFGAELGAGVAGLRLGVPREHVDEGVAPSVLAAVEGALQRLEEAGAEIVEVDLPHTPWAISAYYVIAASEASSNLARFDGVGYGRRSAEAATIDELFARSRSEGFGDEVRRRIMLGTYCLSSGYYDAYYDKALRVRTLIAGDFDRALERCDLLLGPTSPVPPFRLGERTEDPLSMYLADVLTVSLNLAGLPGASVPCGFVEEDGARLPVGLQIVGPRFREASILRLAAAWEEIGGFCQERPGP